MVDASLEGTLRIEVGWSAGRESLSDAAVTSFLAEPDITLCPARLPSRQLNYEFEVFCVAEFSQAVYFSSNRRFISYIKSEQPVAILFNCRLLTKFQPSFFSLSSHRKESLHNTAKRRGRELYFRNRET
jgi:hypothetical protein